MENEYICRHHIGDSVHLTFDEHKTHTAAMVVGVNFIEGKVLYDLAPVLADDYPHLAHPLRQVDSLFVHLAA